MAYSSITAEAFDRMSERESHAIAAEVQELRVTDFKAWVDVLGQFFTALAKARVM